ncbi:hypothetical protein V8G54_030864 [Vigna mungo]|uniref:Uncharacterized protein n=1 Tax=Vigna mungo TaxID=3915 RepID=A0AAQ3RNC9_VIGMU
MAVISASTVSGTSGLSKILPISRRVLKGLKECGRKLVDLELFTQYLEEWVLENLNGDSADGIPSFRSPFTTDELCKLDLAIEGVPFQQLIRIQLLRCGRVFSVISSVIQCVIQFNL